MLPVWGPSMGRWRTNVKRSGSGAVLANLAIENQDIVHELTTEPGNVGPYQVWVSERDNNDVFGYELVIQCISSNCPNVLPPGPVCDIEMSQAVYTIGDTVTVDRWRLANPGPTPVVVEWKNWFEIPVPGTPPIPIIPSHTKFTLQPGTDVDLGPRPLFPVTPATPLGEYGFDCRMIDPPTGKTQTLDLNTFMIE